MRLFAYGTLTDPRLRARLLGRRTRQVPARLPGFCRRVLRVGGERPVPAVRREPGAVVPGALITGLSHADLRLLDTFEDCAAGTYRRIRVATDAGSAWCYVHGPRGGSLGELWQTEDFFARHGADYRDRLVPAFLADYRRERLRLRPVWGRGR